MAEKKPASGSDKKPVQETQESLYKKACAKLAADELIVQPEYRISNFQLAAAMFEEVGDYLDAPDKARYCRDEVERAKANAGETRYAAAVFRMKDVTGGQGEWEHLAAEFEALGDYKDAKEKAALCEEEIKTLKRRHKTKVRVWIAVLVLLAGLAAAAYYSGLYRYVKARVAMENGNYASAEKMFRSMPGFLDSDMYAKESLEQALRKTAVGAEITFGKYKWKILERSDDCVRMIASDIGSTHLFYRAPFHDRFEEVSWEDCSLREWLNTQVLEEIFDDAQRERLVLQKSEPSANAAYGTAYAGETQDYVTILSCEEIQSEKYSKSLESLGHDYWVRTPGNSMDCAAYISADHALREYGMPVNDEQMMVRPVILVSINPEENGKSISG